MQFDAQHVAQVFARHKNIGFQLSGGRDSTAAIYLLRDFWPMMTVYHLDTGDHFLTTKAVIVRVASDVVAGGGRVVRIPSDSKAVREKYGIPSDVVPVDNHEFIGRRVSGRELKIQSRYECCFRSIMLPMHEAMLRDCVTLIVRGQRDDEYSVPPYRDGDSGDGFEFMYPVQDWTAEQVQSFITENDLPIADFYKHGAAHGSDCVGCSAWLDDGRAEYMRQELPVEYSVLTSSLKLIKAEVSRQLSYIEDIAR